MGDYNNPLSLNRWNYVEGNPVNFTDPSGFIPCTESQDINVNRYCVLKQGGYLDVDHFKHKKEDIRLLIDVNLPSQFGKTFGQIPFSGSLGGGLPPTHFAVYYTRLPLTGLPLDKLSRVALGIQLDYEYGFEAAQGFDPRCYTIAGWFSHCSSFSNEDLPSDYLGMVAGIKNISLESIVAILGGGEQQSSLPDVYWGNAWPLIEPSRCRYGFCSDRTPFNDKCTFKVYDRESRKYYNQPWPSSLVLEPYGFREYWARGISEFTNFAIPVPAPPQTPESTPMP
jgi:hypothetical protein